VSCVVASPESVRIFKSMSAEFLIDTPMQSTGATTAVQETVSTETCFLTKFGFELIEKKKRTLSHQAYIAAPQMTQV
jgi:hypothetical protein